MKLAIPIILVQLMFMQAVSGQANEFSLEKCFKLALENHPLREKAKSIQTLNDLELNNLKTNYYPELMYNAQVSYQEPVLEFDLDAGIPLPFELPSQKNDQYKTWVEIRQSIYDGGLTRKKMEIEKQGSLTEYLENEISIDQIKQQISDVYFAILMLDQQIKQMQLIQDDLAKKLENILALVERGVVLHQNYLAMQAEKMKLEQQLVIVKNNRNIAIGSLSMLLNEKQVIKANFTVPDYELHQTDSLYKKEYELFDMTREKLNMVKDIYQYQRRPMVFAFSQLGYGNPGLNMLNDSFEPYYIVGAGLKWNITDWNNTKRNISKQEIQKDNIDIMKDQFDRQLSISINKSLHEINTYAQLLETDQEIMAAYQVNSKTAFSQFENGTLNASEYLTEMHKEKSATINHEINKIKRTQAIVNYYLLTGKL